MNEQPTALNRTERVRPYAMVGAGPVTASIWKRGGEESGWRYRFTVFRMNVRSGRVSQRFEPSDVLQLPKLLQVLAFTLAEDGCLDDSLRRELRRLAERLDPITGGDMTSAGDAEFVRAPRRSLARVLQHLWDHEQVRLDERGNGKGRSPLFEDLLALWASLGRERGCRGGGACPSGGR